MSDKITPTMQGLAKDVLALPIVDGAESFDPISDRDLKIFSYSLYEERMIYHPNCTLNRTSTVNVWPNEANGQPVLTSAEETNAFRDEIAARVNYEAFRRSGDMQEHRSSQLNKYGPMNSYDFTCPATIRYALPLGTVTIHASIDLIPEAGLDELARNHSLISVPLFDLLDVRVYPAAFDDSVNNHAYPYTRKPDPGRRWEQGD